MTSIALIADIHGNLPALEAVVADISAQRVTRICNLGDHASGPLWPAETVAFLMQQTAWVQIAGNHDRQLGREDPSSHDASDRFAFERLSQAQIQWLAALPPTARVEPGILLCHGTPTDDLAPLLETVEGGRFRLARREEIVARLQGATAQVIACGHTHAPRLAYLDDGTVLVNSGSVGLQAFSDEAGGVRYIGETGAPHARYALLDTDGTGWRVTLRAVPYDHASVARRAVANGSTAWAAALRTGYALVSAV